MTLDLHTLPADEPLHLVRGDAIDLGGWCGPAVHRTRAVAIVPGSFGGREVCVCYGIGLLEVVGYTVDIQRVAVLDIHFDLHRPEVRHLVRDRIPGLAWTAALPEWQAVAILGASVRRVRAGEEPCGRISHALRPDRLTCSDEDEIRGGDVILLPDGALLVPIERGRVVRVQAPTTT